MADAPEGAQVNQHVEQGVVVSNGRTIAQFRALDARGDGLTVDALRGSTLLVGLFVDVAVTVELVADTSADAGGERRGAAALGPLFVIDRASLARFLREKQWADVTGALVFNEASTRNILVLEWHGQASLADGQALFIEGEFVATALGEGDGGEASGIVKVLVDVERIIRSVKSAEFGTEAETAFDIGHEREEVGHVGFVERLGEFSQNKLAPVGNASGNDARSIAPVVFADVDRVGRERVGEWSGRWLFGGSVLVASTFAAEATIGITNGLLGFVVAIGDVILGVVLLYPGQDVVRRMTAQRIMHNVSQVEDRPVRLAD